MISLPFRVLPRMIGDRQNTHPRRLSLLDGPNYTWILLWSVPCRWSAPWLQVCLSVEYIGLSSRMCFLDERQEDASSIVDICDLFIHPCIHSFIHPSFYSGHRLVFPGTRVGSARVDEPGIATVTTGTSSAYQHGAQYRTDPKTFLNVV